MKNVKKNLLNKLVMPTLATTALAGCGHDGKTTNPYQPPVVDTPVVQPAPEPTPQPQPPVQETFEIVEENPNSIGQEFFVTKYLETPENDSMEVEGNGVGITLNGSSGTAGNVEDILGETICNTEIISSNSGMEGMSYGPLNLDNITSQVEGTPGVTYLGKLISADDLDVLSNRMRTDGVTRVKAYDCIVSSTDSTISNKDLTSSGYVNLSIVNGDAPSVSTSITGDFPVPGEINTFYDAGELSFNVVAADDNASTSELEESMVATHTDVNGDERFLDRDGNSFPLSLEGILAGGNSFRVQVSDGVNLTENNLGFTIVANYGADMLNTFSECDQDSSYAINDHFLDTEGHDFTVGYDVVSGPASSIDIGNGVCDGTPGNYVLNVTTRDDLGKVLNFENVPFSIIGPPDSPVSCSQSALPAYIYDTGAYTNTLGDLNPPVLPGGVLDLENYLSCSDADGDSISLDVTSDNPSLNVISLGEGNYSRNVCYTTPNQDSPSCYNFNVTILRGSGGGGGF